MLNSTQNTGNTMDSNGIGDSDRLNFVNGGMYPGSQIDHSYYANPTQIPLGAQAVRADYDPETNPLTGEPTSSFASGGITALRFDGTEGSQVEAPPAWTPESGQVKLQQLADPKDPFGEMKSTDYTIPKDQIKTFIPNIDQETGQPNGSGAYVLKDGSTLGVTNFGVVSAATPGRNDYTLNKDGYYQPTGANLTWDGGTNTLTKKVGGVDVMVPGQFHKGGYQDANGNLRVNEDGVPIPLLPNYLDSGVGKSGLADAAPYIAIAMMTAATMGAGATGFAGMVPASETLLGSMGALGATSAVPLSEITGSTFAGPAFTLPEGVAATTVGGATIGADAGGATIGTGGGGGGATIDAGTQTAINSAAAPTYSTVPTIPSTVVPELSSTMIPGTALTLENAAVAPVVAGGITAKEALGAKMAIDMATKFGETGFNNSAAPSATTTPLIFNPNANKVSTPGIAQMGSGQQYGQLYDTKANTYRYYAQGGITNLDPNYAHGGITSLGSYSDGGHLLKGPGDGMSDHIPATIGGKQPARLADGEFVIPADVVSHLGNGSTDAGAKQLYKMMDKIRQARTGKKSQGKQINPNKYLLKG